MTFLIVVLAVIPCVALALSIAVAPAAWGVVFGSYSILEPSVPNKAARTIIVSLWIGAVLYFLGKVAFSNDPEGEDFKYLWIGIATFWIPIILVWIIASTGKEK